MNIVNSSVNCPSTKALYPTLPLLMTSHILKSHQNGILCIHEYDDLGMKGVVKPRFASAFYWPCECKSVPHLSQFG